MTKEDKFIQLELTLGELGVKTVFSKSGQNQPEMFIMLFVGFRIDEDVIDVDNDELVEIIHEDRVHEPHESSWSIGETEGHDSILIKAITSNECRFWDILLSDLDLMVT